MGRVGRCTEIVDHVGEVFSEWLHGQASVRLVPNLASHGEVVEKGHHVLGAGVVVASSGDSASIDEAQKTNFVPGTVFGYTSRLYDFNCGVFLVPWV